MIIIFACKNVFLSSRLLPMNGFLEEKLLNQKIWIFYMPDLNCEFVFHKNMYQFIVPFAAYLCLKYFCPNEVSLNVNIKKNFLFLLVMRLLVLFSFLWLLRLNNFSHLLIVNLFMNCLWIAYELLSVYELCNFFLVFLTIWIQ